MSEATTEVSQDPATETQEAPDWTSTLNEDMKGFVQTKGFQGPDAVIESYRNLEKLVGVPQDQIIKLPKDNDPEVMSGVWKRLGRPDSPDGYKLPIPEGDSGEFAKTISPILHKANLTDRQAETLATEWNTMQAEAEKTQKLEYETRITEETDALKKEWGAAYNDKIQVGKEAMKQFGIEAEVIDALESQIGFSKVLKVMSNIGAKLGESEFVRGDADFSGRMTPAQAKAEIAIRKTDAQFVSRYNDGDKEARQEMENLHKMAFPDET